MDINIQINKLRNLSKKVRIVFPEGNNALVIEAALKLKSENILEPILVVKTSEEKIKVQEAGLECFCIDEVNLENFANQLCEIRKNKGLDFNSAIKLVKQQNYFSTMLLYNDVVDAYVGGITYSTAESIRPGLQIIKTKENINKISSTMILSKDNVSDLYFSDIAVNIEPDSEDLASFTLQLSQLMKSFDVEPNIGLLSFSTKGSAKHPLVDKVIQAGKILDTWDVDFNYDYELQFDAAFDSSIRNKKAPQSNLKDVNGYVFPDLNSANIGYKIAQRLGGYEAIGPIITGFNKVINDLSRGANVEEIYKLAIVSAIQSLNEKY